MRWGVAIDLARSKATGRVDMTSSSGSTPPSIHPQSFRGLRQKLAGVAGRDSGDSPPRKVTAIIWSNGCGKSTLLKAMAGLVAPIWRIGQSRSFRVVSASAHGWGWSSPKARRFCYWTNRQRSWIWQRPWKCYGQRAFCLNARVIDDPVTGGPLIVPE